MGVVLFIDIDGLLFKHHNKGASFQWYCEPTVLEGTIEKFDEWEKAGHYIVLTTSRKDSHRECLEAMLLDKGLYWDQLITGLPHGQRILFNDCKIDGSRSTDSYNILRNKGIADVDISRNRPRSGRSDETTEQSPPTDC